MRSLTKIFFSLIFLCAWATVSQAAFTDPAAWTSYNPGENGVGSNLVGYVFGAFDGQYSYFVPFVDSAGQGNGRVLRYDNSGDFESPASWTAYDPSNNGLGSDARGFNGALFDGRYVYFVPYASNGGSTYSGAVLRYDTQASFSTITSWTLYDPGADGVGTDPDGYYGAGFDGRYIYFAPYFNSPGQGSEVLRYDIQGNFSTAGSWSTFRMDVMGIGTDPEGYAGVVFDGRYMYFVPFWKATQGAAPHSEVVRYDTQASFASVGSWEAYSHGLANAFVGGVFDGKYIYFAPYGNPRHGTVVRFDTSGIFSAASSWTSYDPGDNGLGIDPDGYTEPLFDGRYIYFVPDNNGSAAHGEFLRYDTQGEFSTLSSWSVFDPGANGVGTDPDGYYGGVFDGEYMYFAPFHNGSQYHGEFLRYDTEHNATFEYIALSQGSYAASTATNYAITMQPLVPLSDSSKIVLTFPDGFDPSFDSITPADVNVTATGLDSANITVNPANNTIEITLLTGAEVIISPLLIEIGDGAGPLNDLSNPASNGQYAIGVDLFESDNSILAQGHILASVNNYIQITALVTEALIMTLTGNTVTLNVDPAVNDGVDASEYTGISIYSNAVGGYSIAARLDDGANNAQLTNGNGGSISTGTGDGTFAYEATNATYDNGRAVDGDQSFNNTNGPLLDGGAAPIGHNTVADPQQHTVYYDLDVNFLTPAGIYTGTIYYTVLASF